MRNLRDYPITRDEVTQYLSTLKDESQQEIERSHLVGNMSVLLLEQAIDWLKEEAKVDKVEIRQDMAKKVKRAILECWHKGGVYITLDMIDSVIDHIAETGEISPYILKDDGPRALILEHEEPDK
jgi:hypothetical protein